jgi:glutamyl-tRNA reductase
MTIVNVGLTHRTTPAEVLERLAVPPAQLADVLAGLRAVPAVEEVVVLSTCNRVEVYAATDGPADPVSRAVAGLLADRAGLPAEQISRTAAVSVDAAAVEHLFAVACGLDSMAVGEEQIVAQIREAARTAAEVGTSGPVVTGLVDAALRVSKRARTQTTISTAGISLTRAGLELAATQLDGLAGRRAVVLGTGSVGSLAARLLREAGVGRLTVAGRNGSRVAEIAAALDGIPLRADDVHAALAGTDLLVTATGSATPVVLAEQVRAARQRTGDRRLIVLDLAMPPDVEPAVGRLPGVTLVDIPALGRHLAGQEAPDDVAHVRAIVAAEVSGYLDRQRRAGAAPFITAIHAHVRQLAEAELVRLDGRLPGLSDEQRAETAMTVYRILRKVLHRPTIRAKELSTEPAGAVYLEALRLLFDLGAEEATA